MNDMTTTEPFTTTTLAPLLRDALTSFDYSFLDRLAEDATLRASGEAAWAGTYHGRDAIVGYLLEVGGAFPDQALDVLDTMVSEDRIAVLVRLTISRDGASVTDLSTWTYTFDSAGSIIDWELNDFDQTAMDAFWALFPRPAA